MYPRLSDVFRDLLGFELPFPIYSFGAMVALGVLVAAWLTGRELDRLYAAGQIGGVRLPDAEAKRRRGRVASPSAIIGTVTVIAVVAGFAGAKLFHILENLGAFARDPFGMLFSSGGFTFYGGLIVAGVAIWWYVREKGLEVWRFADAVAPGLIIGYGIGRLGCYLAGDGDWGVCNTLANKPAWLPDWLWSETFPNSIFDTTGRYTNDALVYNECAPGMDGVFPTMLYEFGMAVVILGILWALRRHHFRAGWLFSVYLVFNGLERFLIEQIRVNNEFDLLGMTVTQAEMIAVAIAAAGVYGLARTMRDDVDRPAMPDAAAG